MMTVIVTMVWGMAVLKMVFQGNCNSMPSSVK